MTCKHPQVVRKNHLSKHYKTGKPTVKYLGGLENQPKEIRKAIGKGRQADGMEYNTVNCGKCLNCRLAKAKEWSDRGTLELNILNQERGTERHSCFVTLTYDDEHLPIQGSTTKEYKGEYLLERGIKAEPQSIKSIDLNLGQVQKIIDKSTGEIRYLQGFSKITGQPIYLSTLKYQDIQRFITSLKKSIKRHGKEKFTYIVAGEYGGMTKRPHYHAILFGYIPDDLTDIELNNNGKPNIRRYMNLAGRIVEEKQYLKTTKQGYRQYMSPKLTKLWGKGRVTVSEVNWRTVSYVARYTTKKLLSNLQDNDSFIFLGTDIEGKPVFDRTTYVNGQAKERLFTSKKPAIGERFFDKYQKMILSWQGNYNVLHAEHIGNRVVYNTISGQHNNYFDKLIERIDPKLYEQIKANRKATLQTLNADMLDDKGDINEYSLFNRKAMIEEIKTQNFTRADY